MTQNPQEWQRPPQQWPPQPGQYPPQYQPPRQPPRRRQWSAGKIIAVIAACVVATVVITSVAVSIGKTPAASSSAPPAATGATSASSPATQAAAAATVTYVVTGSGADVTYGPEGSENSGSVPMRKTVAIPASPPGYYAVSAQLQGGGSVTCEILVSGKVISKSAANGSYNIADCEIVQDPITGAWQDANSA